MTYYGMPEGWRYAHEWADQVNATDLVEGVSIIHDHELWTVEQVRPQARNGNPDLREIILKRDRRIGGDVHSVMVPHEHHPVCNSCGGLWPCLEHRMYVEGKRIMNNLRWSCGGCGKPVSGMRSQFTTPDGIQRVYHWAKKYGRCRQAAIAEAQRCGLRLLADGRGMPDV